MRPRPLLIPILLALLPEAPTWAQTDRGTRRNVLLVVLDDLGTEKLSFYGQSPTHPPTPRLAQLRDQGILFTNAYANPVCAPTRAMIQTGRYTMRNGMGTNPGADLTLSSAEVTIAEALKAGFSGSPIGYHCGAFGKWHLAVSDRDHVCANGYDTFVGTLANNANHFHWRRVIDTAFAPATGGFVGDEKLGPFDTTTYDASVVRAAAVDWIAQQAGPFFAYVAFHPPHAPLQVPPLELLSPATRQQVAAEGYAPGDIILMSDPDDVLALDWMIEAVDTEVGLLLDGISKEKRQATTVIVIGDNGTHPSVARPPLTPDHAKGTVYQGGSRVPLIVTGYGIDSKAATCSGVVSAVDLWATIAELTGAQVSAVFPDGDCGAGQLDSVSFRHLLSDPSAASLRSEALVQLFAPLGCYQPDPLAPPALTTHERGMTDGHFKYVRSWNADLSTYAEEAYDLGADPYETDDLFPVLGMLPPADRAAILGLRAAAIALSGD